MNQFLDEIAEHLAFNISTKYPIFLGDFNIHWGDEGDGNASSFADIVEALGLTQHVPFPTHNRNNILDLVISKAITKKFICEVLPGPYITDHLAVQVSIQINREQQKKETIIYQDMKNKSAQNIFEKVNLRVEDFDHVDDIVEHLDKQIDRALNEVAPKCEKTVQIRKKQPWYDTSIKRQKTVMRNREKLWRKYKTPETWMAFDVEKRRYNTLLRQSKEGSIKCKVVECKNNTKNYIN